MMYFVLVICLLFAVFRNFQLAKNRNSPSFLELSIVYLTPGASLVLMIAGRAWLFGALAARGEANDDRAMSLKSARRHVERIATKHEFNKDGEGQN